MQENHFLLQVLKSLQALLKIRKLIYMASELQTYNFAEKINQ